MEKLGAPVVCDVGSAGIVFFSIGSLVGALVCVWFRILLTRYWRGGVVGCSLMRVAGLAGYFLNTCLK